MIVLAALAAVLLGTALAYWLNPPVRLPVLDAKGPALPSGTDKRPRIKGLSYTQVRDGRKQWTLSAQGARLDEDKGQVTLEKVTMRFFPEKGGWFEISGNEGSYDQKKKIVVLEGEVRGSSDDGMSLRTERLTYSESDRMVKSDRLVTIAGPRFKVSGRGMVVDLNRSTIKFQNEVDSTFIPVGSGPPPGATVE